MIDRSLMYRVLATLELVGDLGLREDICFDEIALAANRHVEASEIREHLVEAERKGWVEKTKGRLGETRWRILDAGKNALRDLRN